jgi:hypothetical protein
MRKNVGEAKSRRFLTPESKIAAENIEGVRSMKAETHMHAPGRKPAAERMPATSRIPVSKAVWAELAGLKRPGETYDHLLEEMIEREKKNRLFEDMDRIEKRGKFVAMKW